MTSLDAIRPPGERASPSRSTLASWVAIAALPLLTFVAMLLWQGDARTVFRVIQLCFGWAVVVQMLVVLLRAFECGWYELFAYLLHLVAVGAAGLVVTFRAEQYPQDLLYDQMALLSMAGQLMIGFLVLRSRPLRQRATLDPKVLAICAVVVCTAALAKFGFYIQYVGLAGGEHSAIYTEGDALRDNSPAVIRILAAGAPLVGLLALTQPGLPRWCRALGALSIVLEFAIGIRSRPLFIILAALALFQDRVRFTPARKVMVVALAAIGVLAIAAIGYFREDNSISFGDYFWVILESLFGIFEAGVFGAQIPDTVPIVIGQIGPLIAPTPLGSVDTVAKLLTSTFTPNAYLAGFGYSSAVLTEVVMLFGPVASGFVYPLAVLGILSLIRAAVTSPRNWIFLYGACTLPIAYYIWRAELWQLVLPAIKALPFIAVLLGADAFARLGRRQRRQQPLPGSEPA